MDDTTTMPQEQTAPELEAPAETMPPAPGPGVAEFEIQRAETPAAPSGPMNDDELRAFIDQARDEEYVVMPIPQWGGVQVMVLGMSAEDRLTTLAPLNAGPKGKPDFRQFYARLLSYSVHNPATRARLWTVRQAEQMLRKSSAVVEAIAEIALPLAGINKVDLDRAREAFEIGRS